MCAQPRSHWRIQIAICTKIRIIYDFETNNSDSHSQLSGGKKNRTRCGSAKLHFFCPCNARLLLLTTTRTRFVSVERASKGPPAKSRPSRSLTFPGISFIITDFPRRVLSAQISPQRKARYAIRIELNETATRSQTGTCRVHVPRHNLFFFFAEHRTRQELLEGDREWRKEVLEVFPPLANSGGSKISKVIGNASTW